MTDTNQRPVEPNIVRDFAGKLSYSGYLSLNGLLAQQRPLSEPQHHDEMLFIIQHQVAELWMKLVLHELSAAIDHIRHDRLPPTLKILSRVKLIQMQLFDQWAVLETLTPSEYMEFRSVLGNASGFQSFQYRKLEFLLGNKNAESIQVFAHDRAVYDDLLRALNAPSLYDEFLRYLARRGYNIPAACLERDFSAPRVRNEALVDIFREIYCNAKQHWEAYEMCEKLVDVEEYFQLWRFRHLKTVERIIGFRRGTGGSSGVGFLRQALELTFFPELLASRTEAPRENLRTEAPLASCTEAPNDTPNTEAPQR
jgi:tryptophan 2,3-dioxygenase